MKMNEERNERKRLNKCWKEDEAENKERIMKDERKGSA